MLRLILLRHAKAVSLAAGGDRARPLAPRGRDDAKVVGRYLAREKLLPDLAIVSDARRTRETLDLVLGEIGKPIDAIVEKRLYNCEIDTLLTLAREAPAQARTVLLVGHNPAIAEFTLTMAGRGDHAPLYRLAAKYPTASLAVLDFDASDWSSLGWGDGELERFITPDDLYQENA